MNEFIEKNRRLLKIFCITTRIIGWALILLPVILVIWLLLTGTSRFGDFLSWPLHIEKRPYRQAFPLTDEQVDLLSLVIRFVLPGLLMLGLAQFIRYLSEKNYRAGWTLRCGEGILYLYAVLITGQVLWNYVLGPSMKTNMYLVEGLRPEIYQVGPLTIPASVLLTAAKVVILIGLGQILARVMPVIEESKTLV
jgi:hypothetical protein